MFFDTALYTLLTVVATVLLILALEPLSRTANLVDRPNGRKRHKHPTPVTGGIAIFLALFSIGLVSGMLTSWWLIVGCGLLLVTGMLDDRVDLGWKSRILIQVVAALTIIFGEGLRIDQIGDIFSLGWMSVPFTIFAVVGAINAFNMIDGVDGLAGSLGLATLSMLGAAAVYAGNIEFLPDLLFVIGAIVGFLLLNFPFPGRSHARVFLGNSGSAMLGLIVAWALFRVSNAEAHPVSSILCLWLAAVPVIDCFSLMIYRYRRGASPFSADRLHVHHLFLDSGFSALKIDLLLVSLSLVLGLFIAFAYVVNTSEWLLLGSFFLLIFIHNSGRRRHVARSSQNLESGGKAKETSDGFSRVPFQD